MSNKLTFVYSKCICIWLTFEVFTCVFMRVHMQLNQCFCMYVYLSLSSELSHVSALIRLKIACTLWSLNDRQIKGSSCSWLIWGKLLAMGQQGIISQHATLAGCYSAQLCMWACTCTPRACTCLYVIIKCIHIALWSLHNVWEEM